MNGTNSGLVVLNSVREQAEKASKPPSMAIVSAPASGSCPVSVPVLTSSEDEL